MPAASKKVTLVTGASRGIGRFLAEHYAALGHAVVGCSRSAATWSHPNFHHFTTDVADEKTVRTLFATIRREYGRLDHVVNNAGMASMNLCILSPFRSVQDVFATNMMGTFLFSREAARIMARQNWGRIVNFVTVALPLKLEGEAAYVASKAAVLSFTQVLAREVGSMGITVNAVGPNPIDTDLTRGVPPDKIQALISRQAIRRMGVGADVANVVDFFLRPESDLITGQVLYLGGV